MNIKLLLAALAAASLSLPLAAQPQTPVVDQRQANQKERIQEGVKSGELTKKETAKLKAGQAKVKAKEAKAKSDGKVTAKERAELAKAQNKESRKIYKEKHDPQSKN